MAAIRLLSLDVDIDRVTGGVGCLFVGINDISFGCCGSDLNRVAR